MEASDLSSIYRSGEAITPNDGADIPGGVVKALYIGGTGAVKVNTVDGSTLTFAAVAVGIFPIRAKRVWATGTAATNIIGLR